MGLEDRVRAAGTGEVGLRFVDDDGSIDCRVSRRRLRQRRRADGRAGDPAQRTGPHPRRRMPATVEFVFGDAHRIGRRRTRRGSTSRSPEASTRRFDLLIVAEGIRSTTRNDVFGAEPDYRDLGFYTAYCTISEDRRRRSVVAVVLHHRRPLGAAAARQRRHAPAPASTSFSPNGSRPTRPRGPSPGAAGGVRRRRQRRAPHPRRPGRRSVEPVPRQDRAGPAAVVVEGPRRGGGRRRVLRHPGQRHGHQPRADRRLPAGRGTRRAPTTTPRRSRPTRRRCGRSSTRRRSCRRACRESPTRPAALAFGSSAPPSDWPPARRPVR